MHHYIFITTRTLSHLSEETNISPVVFSTDPIDVNLKAKIRYISFPDDRRERHLRSYDVV